MENPTQPPSSEHSANSAREKLRSYLGSQMKVVISDGRVLIGEFMCTDNERNLILGNCDEYIPMNEGEGVNQQESLSRMLSLAIIPGHHISSISIAKGKSSNEGLTDPSAMKHAQHKNQHQKSQDKNQHEDHQHENHDDQHENHHGDQHDINQFEDRNQHKDENDDHQREDQHDDNQNEDQNDKKLGNKNSIDVHTEEYGQTREDSNTPQEHLTLQ